LILEAYDDIDGPTPVVVSNGVQRNLPLATEGILKDASVYPNPFRNELQLNVKTTKSGQLSAVMFDMLGRKIFRQDFGNLDAGSRTLKLDMSKLENDATGVYILQIMSDGKIEKTIKLTRSK
jgi:hypothetical protein